MLAELRDDEGKPLYSVGDEIEALEGAPRPSIAVMDLAVADSDAYTSLADGLAGEFGRLDGLVNNAGILGERYSIEQYDAAIQNYEGAIEIIEDQLDRLDAQLINPLKGLGAAQLANGRPDEAAATFTRAVHISHVNEGPHNIDQVPILESLAETNLLLGELDQARNVHELIYNLNERYYRTNMLDLVPSLMRRARWQHRTGYYNDERATWRRIIRIIEEKQGNEHGAAITYHQLGRIAEERRDFAAAEKWYHKDLKSVV